MLSTDRPHVTPEDLRAIFARTTFESDRVEVVRSLADRIADKGGAAIVIADTFTFSSNKLEAIAALNGKLVGRERIDNPTLTDRIAGAAYGLALPLRRFGSVALLSVFGAWAFGLVGVPLGDVAVLNALPKASGIAGFGADVLAALTSTTVSLALVGATASFANPSRPLEP